MLNSLILSPSAVHLLSGLYCVCTSCERGRAGTVVLVIRTVQLKMDHFRLNWDHYHSTLVNAFNTMLESGKLVDCTLAAEGQYLKAHKVVLSACSPYLELLLSQHNEKHPIVILQNVKFQELKSIMDFMYKGYVIIPENQVSSFLKAGKSLQIKSLIDGDGNEDGTPNTTPAKASIPAPVRKPVQQAVTRGTCTSTLGLMIERRSESPHIRSRDSALPTPRKRRRNQSRPSTSDNPDSHIDRINSCDVRSLQSKVLSGIGDPKVPAAMTKSVPLDDGDRETGKSCIYNHGASDAEGVAGSVIEPTGELIEYKTEYVEEINNQGSIEVMILDDDDDMIYSMGMSRAGLSRDNSNQSSGQCLMSGSQTTDEVFVSQKGKRVHMNTQGINLDGTTNNYVSSRYCGKSFKCESHLSRHLKNKCDIISKLKCPYCDRLFNQKDNLKNHCRLVHKFQFF